MTILLGGVGYLPIDPFNKLLIETEVIEGADEHKISELLKSLFSVTFKEIQSAKRKFAAL